MDLKYNEAIQVNDLGKFWVDGEMFYGIAYEGLANVNTKTYVEEPSRTNDLSIPNIDEYETGLVPRATFTLKYFSIRDYQRFCRVVQSANSYDVKYWDKDYGTFVTHNMYLEQPELTKLYNVRANVLGVLDYTISFIGTRNNRQEYDFVYKPQYWNGTNLVELTANTTPYSDTVSYSKGQIVFWNGEYYEAIYYSNTFKGKAPPNITYWQVITPTQWDKSTQYEKGMLVYSVTNGVKTYYEAIGESFSGYSLSNAAYWKTTNIEPYKAATTYSQNQYCMLNDIIYKAIYYVDIFSGMSPDNTSYWAKRVSPINNVQKIKWGDSTQIIASGDIMKFYNIPVGKEFIYWNTRADGKGFTVRPNRNYTVTENTTLYPILGE